MEATGPYLAWLVILIWFLSFMVPWPCFQLMITILKVQRISMTFLSYPLMLCCPFLFCLITLPFVLFSDGLSIYRGRACSKRKRLLANWGSWLMFLVLIVICISKISLGFNLSMGYKERYILCHCMTFRSYWVQGLAIKIGQEWKHVSIYLSKGPKKG